MIETRDFDWDDDLLHAALRDGQPRVRVYRPHQTAVVLGRGSQPEVEVQLDAVGNDGIALLKRRGGGCSVVLDPGNLIVSVALPIPGFGGIRPAFRRISDWLIGALARAGIPGVKQAGISDLAFGNRKLGGACIYRARGLLYYSTTLLFQPDLNLVEKYLKHPPREPEYRAGRSHRAFMGSLADVAGLTGIDSFAARLDRILRDSVKTLVDLDCRREIGQLQSQTTHEVLT